MSDENVMVESKPWYQSRGMVSGIVAFLVIVGGFFSLDFQGMETEITDAVMAVLTAGATAVAIYGRVKATKVIE